MPAPNTTRWIGTGLLGLPLYGALTLWSSLDPQPDPDTHYEEWARFVTTDQYVLGHVFGTGLGLLLAIFGVFALGVWLSTSRSGRLGLVAMALTVFGTGIFLLLTGVSAFTAPWEGRAYLAGVKGLSDLPSSFADRLFGALFLAGIGLPFLGHVLLGVAVWRSGVLPRWSGGLWVAAQVCMYVLGLAYAVATGVQSTPPTVPVGALLAVLGGGWMAWSVLRPTNVVPAFDGGR
ncbi:hypothetical protein Rumeso_03459 [Rubellimicrobium mesophilum DSM 19309]|uniref:DUF4386 family protein n=1 Tax=Rubellimicrobium mesophilum DSM 19309 TaxID=442562 RepID=A0A017HKC9_9RHOB|nr:hypothetical protein [Rubellimicrobium mesophilum]EYD74947.1 hypothetical protein Rumeso_03459 [Rubellimicrobium mesophilum DSM 19309]